MAERSADTEQAVEATASTAASPSLETESLGGAPGGLGQLLAGRVRAAPRVAIPPPTGRGGRNAAAARTLLLQRAAGNAATARTLARQETKTPPTATARRTWVRPPRATAPTIAAWAAKTVGAKHRDAIAVVDAARDEVWVFEDGAEPKARKRFAIPRRPHHQILTYEGVWRYKPVIDAGLLTDGSWYPAGWVTGLAHDLVAETDKAEFDKFNPEDPNVWYVIRPNEGDVLDADVPEPEPKPEKKEREAGWAYDDVKKARAKLADKKKDPAKPGDKPPPPIRDIVVWPRKDGTWWVNVWVGGDHEPVQLNPDESTDDLAKRIERAAETVKGRDDPALSTRVQGTKPGPPEFKGTRKPGEGASHVPGRYVPEPGPAGKSPYNAPAFPAKIISHGSEGSQGREGAEVTVNGASVNFTMSLDYEAVTDSWFQAFLASWTTIEYTWDIFDISKVQLGTIKQALGKPNAQLEQELEQAKKLLVDDPDNADAKAQIAELQKQLASRGKDPESGRLADIGREWANTWEDTKADVTSLPMFIPYVNIGWAALIAVSDVVQLVGAPIKQFFSALAAPIADKEIGFSSEGTYLIRCVADPVITADQVERIKAKGMEPIFRPPSVAYIAVRVTPINKRASEVNDAELTLIDNLQTLVNSTTDDDDARADYQTQLTEAREALADNNVQAIQRSRRHAEEEKKRVDTWKAEQAKDTPIDKLPADLVKWRAALDMRGVDINDWKKVQDQIIEQLDKTLPRIRNYGLDVCDKGNDDNDKVFRPRMTLVSEVDGRVYPLVVNLAQELVSKPGDRRWRLIDVTDEETKRIYKGTGSTHNEAINKAFTDFKERCAYGRGTIAIRLPPQLSPIDGETIKVDAQMRAQPGFGERFESRLSDLATAAEVASLFVTGPIGAGIGFMGGLISAGLAIKNFVTRMQAGKPFLSFETAMDALAVVGAFLMIGQAAGKSPRLAALARRAKPVGTALHVITTAGQVIVIPASLLTELSEITAEEKAAVDAAAKGGPPVDRSKFAARRAIAWARAVKSGVVMVRMTQMASDPEAGWDPLKKKGDKPAQLPPGTSGEPPPTAKTGTGGEPSTRPPPAAGGEHVQPGASDHPVVTPAPPKVMPHDPFHAAEQQGSVTSGTGESVVKAAGDWKLRLRKMVDAFLPANKAQAAQELADTRRAALDAEYGKAGASHDCVPFDVGTVGFDSDIDATMIPKEALAGHTGPKRPVSEQIRAAAEAAQQVVNGLRQKFGGDPDTVLDVAIHAYVGEDIPPQYKSPAEAAAARALDTAVSYAEMRRGMSREEWKQLEADYEAKLGGPDAHPLEKQMLDQIKQQMIEGHQFKQRMDTLMSETMAKIATKKQMSGEQASSLARDQILLQKRQALAEAFKSYPDVDWVAIKKLQAEIRWFAPGAYASEAAFTYAVKYGQVRKEAGKATAKAAGTGPPTTEQVLADLNPNLDEERWVSPAERSAKLAAAAQSNIGELGRHPHGAEPKAAAKDAAKYAGRVLEAAETMGGPVRHGPMEDALRLFKESKWPDGTPELRDRAVARWAEQALDGKGVTHNPDGSLTISNETYEAFSEAAKAWMRKTALDARINERWLADQTDAPSRPTPKAPGPPPSPAFQAIGLSEAAQTAVLAAMPADTAVAVAGWLGKERLETISGSADQLQMLLDAHQRVLPALTDPLALAGLRRLTEKNPKLPGAQTSLKDKSVLNAIMEANPNNLTAALRIFGRPDMQSPGLHPQRSRSALADLSRDITRITAIEKFGPDAYDELARNYAVRTALEKKVEGLSDPAARAAEIERILNAESTAARRGMLGLPGPKRRSRSLEVKPDKSDPAAWKEYEDDALAFIKDPEHAKKINPLTGKAYSEMTEQERTKFVEGRATLLQIKDRFVDPVRYKEFQKLTQEQKLKILDSMDAFAETHGVLPQWNPRARVAEALYVPGGGFSQKTFPNPVFPTPGGRPGGSRLDGVFKPGERSGLNSGTEWVEFKSNKTLTAGLAEAHAEEAFQDWHALLWDKALKDDGLVMWYAREPPPGIKAKMLKALLGPASPFRAVRFGDGDWIPRAADTPMPTPVKPPPWATTTP